MSLPPPITPEEIAALPPEFQALLRAMIDHYERRIAALEAEVAAAKKTPRSSSVPPSTVHPCRFLRQERKSGKKRGGQPGHPATSGLIRRTMSGVVVPVQPETAAVAAKLTGSDPEPLRTVFRIPEIKPFVTEYQLHRLTCPCCQERTCGQLPPGVPQSQAGPRLVALAALLMGCFRQSSARRSCFWARRAQSALFAGLGGQAAKPRDGRPHASLRGTVRGGCRAELSIWASTNRR